MKLVIACDPSGGIGLDNRLPWDKLEGDLYRFKRLTQDGIVIMGRNTWHSLPFKPLPNRLNFVVTSTQLELLNGAIAVSSLNPFENHPNVWLIGGAKLVNSSWSHITEVHLSKTHDQYPCDTFIDLLPLHTEFKRIHISHHKDHDYEIWERMNEPVSQPT